MKKVFCLLILGFLILTSAPSVCSSGEGEVILNLLLRKGIITEQEAVELEKELDREREAGETGIKVDVKEEISEEGSPLESGGRFSVYGSLDTLFYVHNNAFFNKGEDAVFDETVGKIGFKLDLTDRISADLRLIAASTAGDDGPLFGTESDDITVDMDLANLSVHDVLGFPLTLTLGRQEILVGDGFLIGDGRFDTTAFWILPLKSFDAARGTLDLDPFTIDFFAAFLDNDWEQYFGEEEDQLPSSAFAGGGELYGGNLHAVCDACGDWDLGVFFRNDDSDLQNDTVALSLRGSYPVPILSGLLLAGELVQELGETNTREGFLLDESIDRRSLGGHIDVTYTFETAPFTPFIGGSYIYLPGDDPDTTEKNEAFDPLFFDWQDWGKWYIGNIVGGSGQLINSNEQVWKFEAGIVPTPSTQLRVQFFNFQLDEGVDDFSRREYANEVNVIFDYWPNEMYYAGAAFGFAHPLEAAAYWNADPETGEDADEDIVELLIWAGVEF